jgi:hypothetical protein
LSEADESISAFSGPGIRPVSIKIATIARAFQRWRNVILKGDVYEIRPNGIVAGEESLAVFKACFKSGVKLVERASDGSS